VWQELAYSANNNVFTDVWTDKVVTGVCDCEALTHREVNVWCWCSCTSRESLPVSKRKTRRETLLAVPELPHYQEAGSDTRQISFCALNSPWEIVGQIVFEVPCTANNGQFRSSHPTERTWPEEYLRGGPSRRLPLFGVWSAYCEHDHDLSPEWGAKHHREDPVEETLGCCVSDITRSSPSSKWRRRNPLFCVWEEPSTQTCCTCASCSSLVWQVQQRWPKHVLSTVNAVNTSPRICTRSYILPDDHVKTRGAKCVRNGYS
jgi:hypothetical protein